MSEHHDQHEHAAHAAQKLEHLFDSLPNEEKEMLTELVRSALLQAASHSAGATTVPAFVAGITGAHAPKLVASLRFPGSLAAHSIPGCNASALAALRDQAAKK